MDTIKRVAVIDILREQAFFLNNFPHRCFDISRKFTEAICLLRKLHREASEDGYTRNKTVCYWSQFWLRELVGTLQMGCDTESAKQITRVVTDRVIFELLQREE
jgi:hypothetical protein